MRMVRNLGIKGGLAGRELKFFPLYRNRELLYLGRAGSLGLSGAWTDSMVDMWSSLPVAGFGLVWPDLFECVVFSLPPVAGLWEAGSVSMVGMWSSLPVAGLGVVWPDLFEIVWFSLPPV